MSRWHNLYLDAHAHLVTATVRSWRPLLKGEAVEVLYREWSAARARLCVRLLAYVVMPEHFHAILWAETGTSVRTFLQQTLSLSARAYQHGGRFWKERPRVLPIYSDKVLQTKVDYLHANPVRRELVAAPADWPDSSFRQLVSGETDVPFLCDESQLVGV